MSSSSGFVYVMSNPSMPGIVKIGRTATSPDDRARSLSKATAAPSAFVVLAWAAVANPSAEEASIHRALKQFRVKRSREFFLCHQDSWAALAIYQHPRATDRWIGDGVLPSADSRWTEVKAWDGESMVISPPVIPRSKYCATPGDRPSWPLADACLRAHARKWVTA